MIQFTAKRETVFFMKKWTRDCAYVIDGGVLQANGITKLQNYKFIPALVKGR